MAKQGELIANGFNFPLENNQECTIKEFLGGGGQGEVYRVTIDGRNFALKWYFDRCQTSDLRNSLKVLIEKGAPSKAFLWPIRLVEYRGKFGYVMDLRPSTYENSEGIISRELNLSYTTVCNACLQLIDAFRQLHIGGLSYQDISWGNIFIDPQTGNVLICDNDNVAPHGATVAGISGTPGFMAPEIVRGEARPDTYTDLFSMAVLIFRMLFIEHPFNGRRYAEEECLDDDFRRKIYGYDPIFIYDPNNNANRPDPDTQSNAEIFRKLYPKYLRDLFTTTFTKGLTDRQNGRPMEEAWINAFRRIRESIFPCPFCGVSVIYNDSTNKTIICFKCMQNLNTPPRMKISTSRKERILIINPNTKIYAYQLDPGLFDIEEGDVIVGEVAQNPKNPSVWGLRNLTGDNWFYSTANGEEKSCAPNKAIVLNKELSINFGTATGETLL